MSKADFTFKFDKDENVHIRDQDLGNMSVTNDIENVLADINNVLMSGKQSPLSGRKVTYTDSQGQDDMVEVDADNKFVRFIRGV